MFLMFPPRMALDWSVQSMHDPRHPSWYGFQSETPLMGGAVFDLRLPRRASGLYVGVRDWHQGHRTWLRVDNLFRQDCTVSVGLNDHPPQPRRGQNRCVLQPQRTHRFCVRWNQRTFEVNMDGNFTTAAHLRGGSSSVASFRLGLCTVWRLRGDDTSSATSVSDTVQHTCDVCTVRGSTFYSAASLGRVSTLFVVDLRKAHW